MEEEEYTFIPPDIKIFAEPLPEIHLPQNSKEKYSSVYQTFQNWRNDKNAPISEDVMMAYFQHLQSRNKPNSLWAMFSMLKKTLKLNDQVDIGVYSELVAFLKRNSENYVPKKAKVLSNENIEKFLNEAPDHTFLAMKVALIFGIMGGLRIGELVNITENDVSEHDGIFFVRISQTETKKSKSFTIHDEYFDIVKRYTSVRPQNSTDCNRFFLTYRHTKCFPQPIGKNTLAAIPKKIAEYLNLENPASYTGHTFRRSSATLMANAGADSLTFKSDGGWQAPKIAESYEEDPIASDTRTVNLIASEIKPPTRSATDTNSDLPETGLPFELLPECSLEIQKQSSTIENYNSELTSNLPSELRINHQQLPNLQDQQNIISKRTIHLVASSATKNTDDRPIKKFCTSFSAPIRIVQNGQLFIYGNEDGRLPNVSSSIVKTTHLNLQNCNVTININK